VESDPMIGLFSVVYCGQCRGTKRVPVGTLEEKELTGTLCPRCEVKGVNSPLRFSHLEDGSVEL
jgi:hypothetical protein